MLNHGVSLTLALPKCVYLPYLRHISLITKIYGLLLLIMYFYLITLSPLIALLQVNLLNVIFFTNIIWTLHNGYCLL